MEKTRGQQTPTVSKTWLIEQVKLCLRSSDFARALDLLRGAAAEFPNDNNAELSELEKLAQDGVKRKAEADRLITESQELFSQRKAAEAIQLLRKAHELDKNNSLARAILANALVEHAQAMVETDWLKAEALTNQALALNPAHPTAKTILSLIVTKKETSSVQDWVSQARKLQSSGDLFAALASVAEGLAVHPHDTKLLQIQDEIQRDQEARRRQARRGDLEDLRRLQREIDGATDVAAKQALAVRIQAVAAKHWTDGEMLSIANALLLRLGLVPQESSSPSPHGKGATVILHVPRFSAPKPSPAETSQAASKVKPSDAGTTSTAAPVMPSQIPPSQILPGKVSPAKVSGSTALQGDQPPSSASARLGASAAKLQPQSPRQQSVADPVVEPPAPASKVASSSLQATDPVRSNLRSLVLVAAAAAIVAVAATLFFARKHYAQPAAEHTPPSVIVPAFSEPAASMPVASAAAAPVASASPVSTPAHPTPAPSSPEPALPPSSDAGAGKATHPESLIADDQPLAESIHNLGTLLVVAGQDEAKVSINGRVQRQLTRAGQLRLPNLEPNDYVVQVSKNGFQDPPQQTIRIRKGEQARLVFSLQPQPRLASLTIQGGAPGTTVVVDQTPVGTIQSDGTLSVSTINPGDHTVELRKERFKARQFTKHFVAGGAISLAAGDAALEALPGELKITFSPADATVVLVKGDLLKMVKSGVPLNLAAGTYTLTARTADRFTRTSTLEVAAGQSKTLDLPLAPNGMSKWEAPGDWKHEGDSFIRKGGDFVLYGVVPASGTFAFSAMPTKGRLLQWVFNYTDPKNYILFQMDDNNFYRTVIHNGEKRNQIVVPDKSDKKSFRILQVRVSPTEIVHQIRHGDRWTILDRWSQPGANLGLGKFGFYLPGNDEVAISSFTHYVDLNLR